MSERNVLAHIAKTTCRDESFRQPDGRGSRVLAYVDVLHCSGDIAANVRLRANAIVYLVKQATDGKGRTSRTRLPRAVDFAGPLLRRGFITNAAKKAKKEEDPDRKYPAGVKVSR
jgi:hypothetical protein